MLGVEVQVIKEFHGLIISEPEYEIKAGNP
jgi:hypothetical protein